LLDNIVVFSSSFVIEYKVLVKVKSMSFFAFDAIFIVFDIVEVDESFVALVASSSRAVVGICFSNVASYLPSI
jgi:hypothetical protein